jgi:hypothetical protein
VAVASASRGNVHFTITAKDFASRTIRGVGHSFTFLGMRARAADRSMHSFFWRGTDDVKMWMRVITLGMPLIPPLLTATANAAAGMVSAFVSMGPGVAAMAAALIGNFKKIKKEAGIGDLRDAWRGFLKELQPQSLRTLTIAFRTLGDLLGRLDNVARPFFTVFNRWLAGLEQQMAGRGFKEFLRWVQDVGAVNFGSFLRGTEAFITGLGNLAMAFSDSGLAFSQWFEDMGRKWERWTRSLKRPKALEGFLDYFRETWPAVKEMFRQFVRAIGNILEAVAPLGKPMAEGLGKFFKMIADADPAHIRRVGLALLTLTALRGLGAAGAAVAGLGAALAKFNRHAKDAPGHARRTEKGFIGLGKGGTAARLGILGATLAISGWVSEWVQADRDTSQAWGRMKRNVKTLGDTLHKAFGPSMRAILTGFFNAVATGSNAAARAIPAISRAAQIAARGASHAFEIILRGLGRMLLGFARAASKLAPFNPIMGRIAGAMVNAAGKAFGLARAIANLRSKSITVRTTFITTRITNFVSNQASTRDPNKGDSIGFATGGRPPVGRASWVGEKGPELFIPDRPGTIYPHEQSMRMAASAASSGTDGDLAKAVAKAVAAALNGATLRLVDRDGPGRRAYLLTGGNV